MMRIGIGYDVHKLVKGRKLILGGVIIPFEKGLYGHSDADVLVHALCDAILGAAGFGDIGQYFSDNDPEFKNIYSIKLLVKTCTMITRKGFKINNIDSTIFAQQPNLAHYKETMKRNIAKAITVESDKINIKATTTEGLGMIGEGNGIGAMCIVLISEISV